MRSILSAFVTAPVFANEDQTTNARLAYVVFLSTLFLNILSVVIGLLFSPFSFNISLNLLTAAVQIVLLVLVRRGYVTQSGIIFALVCWLFITYAAHTVNGLVNPIIGLYVIPILFTGLLVGIRAAGAVTTLCIVTIVAFAFSAEAGNYPLDDHYIAFGTRVGNYVSLFGFTGVTIYLSVGTMRKALSRARSSEAQLREGNLQLQAESEKLEKAQRELTEIELRWRFALEGSATGIWDMNLETGEVFRSPRYLELLGYTPETANRFTDITALIHPDELPTVLAKRDTFLASPTASYENEMRIRCADGCYKWFVYRGNIIERKADGTALRFAGTLTDISERKALEAAQQASELGYRTLFDNNPNPMWVFEKDTLRFIAVNDAAVALYGYKRDEFLNMVTLDIRSPDEEKRLDVILSSPMPVLSKPEMWRHRTYDGRVLQVEITGHETLFKDKPAYLVLIRDLTTQKETEESLRATEDLFNKLFDNVPVGVTVSRQEDGRYLSVNPYLASMLDYSQHEMVGRSSIELKILEPAARTKYVEGVLVQRSTPAVFKHDLKLRTRGGRNLDVLISTQPVKIAGEDALLSFVVDVTAIKRTERERAQIEILQSELDKQREIVELKERFIASVSHEFRSPLTLMLTGVGVLQMYDEKFTPEQRVERLGKVESQIHYLNDLLDRILTISKGHAGKFQFNPHSIDLVHFCRELFEDFRLTDNDQHIFVFEESGDFSNAQMDDKLLQHILMNLISNAVKYSPAGKEINLLLKRDGNHVVIEVSDQGIGIPEDEQNQVFQPFFRSQNAGTIKGTGLGLAITKESVDAHYGSITWHSQQGKGTTFTVRLPGGFASVMLMA